MGQGIRTAITRLMAEDLELEPAAVEVSVGDTRRAPQHLTDLTAGSWAPPPGCPPCMPLCANCASGSTCPTPGGRPARRGRRHGRSPRRGRSDHRGPGSAPEIGLDRLRKGLVAIAGPEYSGFVSFSYIARFAEVRIEPNHLPYPGTARRQRRRLWPGRQPRDGCQPRARWSDLGHRRDTTRAKPGRYPLWRIFQLDPGGLPIVVNADIHQIDVDFVNEPDPLLNPVGVKRLGEVTMVGVSAAIGNAVFHATGTRFRRLPIRIEGILASL